MPPLLSAACVRPSRTDKLPVMAKVKKVPKLPKDVREMFARFGSEGGKIGGKLRWKGTTPGERSEIARKAVNARWQKRNSE